MAPGPAPGAVDAPPAESSNDETPDPAPSSPDAPDASDAATINPTPSLVIGFNGRIEQVAKVGTFWQAEGPNRGGPKLCHFYPTWDVALRPAGEGDVSLVGSRAYLEKWLETAEGLCDEVLMSFKSHPKANGGRGNDVGLTTPPTVAQMRAAFEAFVATKWVGYTGTFSFAPWNEPNNADSAGTGLGQELTPERAAEYYLALRAVCGSPQAKKCLVVAGDFASNGTMVGDYQSKCANDDVPASQLCLGATYLDRYKNFIVNHADDAAYALDQGFRPEYFAFHPWFDVNDYLRNGAHCNDIARCSTKALLAQMSGTWANVELWDTEIGVGQNDLVPNDALQSCGAAYLIRLSNLSPRITRLYYTHLASGSGRLLAGTTARPALGLLAARATQAAGQSCP